MGSNWLPLFRGDIFLSGLDNLSVWCGGLCTLPMPLRGGQVGGVFIVSPSTLGATLPIIEVHGMESTNKTRK